VSAPAALTPELMVCSQVITRQGYPSKLSSMQNVAAERARTVILLHPDAKDEVGGPRAPAAPAAASASASPAPGRSAC
jgi:hypothetical protein